MTYFRFLPIVALAIILGAGNGRATMYIHRDAADAENVYDDFENNGWDNGQGGWDSNHLDDPDFQKTQNAIHDLEPSEPCDTHSDCPDHLACYTDMTCKDICRYSFPNLKCGSNAGCIVRNHEPVCACLPGYEGDTRSGCRIAGDGGGSWENSGEASGKDSGEGSDYQNDGSEHLELEGDCDDHSDCPNNLSCFVDRICRDSCIYTNHGLNCGKFAVCQVVNHHPVCQAVGSSFGRRK